MLTFYGLMDLSVFLQLLVEEGFSRLSCRACETAIISWEVAATSFSTQHLEQLCNVSWSGMNRMEGAAQLACPLTQKAKVSVL